MPFESIPDVMLVLNPAVGDTQIVLVFPARSVKHDYERFKVMLGEWDDAQLVDHVYSSLQMQAIFALMLNYDMNNEIYVYEKNVYYANGSKWNENQCPYNLIPVADMYICGNYYQVALVNNVKDIPHQGVKDTKVYWVPVAYQWEEWTPSDQDGYWNTMVSQILYVHDDMYNRVEETSADVDMVHTDNEPIITHIF